MVTQRQAKKIAVKTAIVTGVDKMAYGKPITPNQAIMDGANFTISEYFTRDMALERMNQFMSMVPAEQRDEVVETLVNVAQDWAMSRFLNGRKRSIVESAIAFSSANFGGNLATEKFPILQ